MNKRSAIRSLPLLFSTLVLTRLTAALAPEESERERGDVPGWVMITFMTGSRITLVKATLYRCGVVGTHLRASSRVGSAASL